MLGASSAKSSSMMQRTTATTPAPRGSLVTMSVSAFTIGSAAVSAQPEPQTAFLRSPADIGRGRGSPRGIGALGGPPGLVPTNERQSLVTEAYLARNREFESRSLQQRVRCELDLAARKSQKGRLGTRAASRRASWRVRLWACWFERRRLGYRQRERPIEVPAASALARAAMCQCVGVTF